MPRKTTDMELIARRERRKKMTAVLQDLGVDSVDGVHDLFKELIGTVLTNGLEGELDEELGYSNIRLPQQRDRQ
jgi:transposase-like protein